MISERELKQLEKRINKYKKLANIERVYLQVVGKVACNCSVNDFKSHLLSKVDLYREFKSELLEIKINKMLDLV